ncbi:MAG: hypothetical protein HY922_02075 [Elusimicrobia bacterium]|nr:hypothetical protein [Elusimicrobiota bacterium]
MSGPDMDSLARWVARWKKAGPELERIRREELLHVDVAGAIEMLEDAFLSALRNFPPQPASGLVEQQRLFGRLRP